MRSLCKCKLQKLQKLKETLLKEHPDCYEPIRDQFELQEETIETLVQIEDAGLDYDEWVSIAADSAWTSRVLKLFLYMQPTFSQVHKWARWPDIFFTPDAQFFKKASAHLQDDIDDFDNYLCQTAADNFNLETITPEHMCRLECLVKLLGKELLDPLCD